MGKACARLLAAGATVLPLAACGPSVAAPIPLRLAASRELPAEEGERIRELRFHDPEGNEVTAVLREPGAPGPPWGGVVLVAGRETGRQAAAILEGPLQEAVLALEYPEELPETFTVRRAMRNLPSLRRTALRIPGLLRGGAAWLASRESVDARRMVLVGVSYGVPFAAAAGPDTLFRGVALYHGGADLALLLRTNLPVRNRAVRAGVARLGAWYLRALEPARHVGRIAPTPLLLINGEHDDLVPRASAERLLDAARPPVRQIWLPHGHLMPDDHAHMRELADSTLTHFRFLRPDARPGEAAPGGR